MGPDKRVNNIIEKNLKVMFEISTPLCAAKLYAKGAFIVLFYKLVIRVRNVHPIVPLKKAKARQINLFGDVIINSAVSSMPTWESNTAVSWQPQSLSVAPVQCTLYMG